MVTEITNVPHLAGLSSDSKPTNYPNGTKFTEIDTGKEYRLDRENSTWYDQNPAPSP